MEKEKNKIKSNKNFWKWTGYSLFLILFGTSAVVNISYLPKYFALKKHEEQTKNQILNINISAHDEKNKKLFAFHYQTILATLGNLMEQDSKTYILESHGTLGKYLQGINYYDENNDQQTKEGTNNSWWAVYYNGEIASVGIDSLYLNANDNIELRFQTISF